jgi:hypothetical protein
MSEQRIIDLHDLQKPLTVDQIDFRIQSVSPKGWATILAYKDARVDMQRLDEVVGPLQWKREHSRDNANCTVSIYSPQLGMWVSKEDVGTPSNTESEKGLASDAFKRAAMNLGTQFGLSLYNNGSTNDVVRVLLDEEQAALIEEDKEKDEEAEE